MTFADSESSKSEPSNEAQKPMESKRLLRFETAEEFRSRPNYCADLEPEKDKPLQIFGGYGFKKGAYVHCGLVGCKQYHGAGFNVVNAIGKETNIGRCCGKTRLGAEWAEMEARFQKQTTLQALQDVLAEAMRKRQETLANARKLSSLVEAAHRTVDTIIAAIASDRPLHKAFLSCQKDRGRLSYFRKLDADERALYPGQSTVRTPMGYIDGINAASVSPKLIRELKFKIIVPLEELEDDSLALLSHKALAAKSLEFGAMGGLLQTAELFIADAEKLSRQKNWENFENFCVASQVNMSANAHRILRGLAGTL
ncbi:MAG: hypothetical protein PSV26_14365 [Polaromonas sp.]|uniref:hypothetical protein n=1 Tax=Polaromonas sp. TaxID=1869339 RepID=UPI00248A3C88|nr:hypothetical protein [Polaromonas sp.]MDI1238662.1 hypothetical protein [Polaromonas sp.]